MVHLFKRITLLILPLLIIALPTTLSATGAVRAQTATSVQCGSIINAEFTSSDGQIYQIKLSPGDSMALKATVVGEYLLLHIYVYDQSGHFIAESNNAGPSPSPSVNTGPLSARGIYQIEIKTESSMLGLYTLYVSCTLHDGPVIKAGAVPSPPPTGNAPLSGGTAVPLAAFSGVGFPGLAAVDFSNVAKIPIQAGTPITGGITPTGGEILGYTFDGKANAVAQLDFSKLSGNLNLGLVVLSADNKVVFQASLVTSKSLSTQFTLPSAGQYTVGVFRIELIPPAKPIPTAFQLQVQLK